MTIEKSVLSVEGMSCSHCVSSIKEAVGALPGVSEVEVDLEGKLVSVHYESNEVSVEAIKETINDQGFEVK